MIDPVSRLLLDELGPIASPVVVLDDSAGRLATALLSHGLDVRAHCDDLRDERALPPGVAVGDLGAALFDGARTVVARLPQALDALDEWAELIAAHAHPEVRFVAGARVKHMTRTMNTTLERHFREVRASLGRNKSRVLHASGAQPGPLTWPRQATRTLPAARLRESAEPTTVVAHGAVFAGTGLDAGTQLLLDTLTQHHLPPGAAVDFGSGSGLISTWLARRGHRVTSVDVSAAACASTAATLAANGLSGSVLRADGLADLPSASVDLLVSNPPFHIGTAKDSTPTLAMIDEAARVLRPGGEIWLVYNAHLPYLQQLRTRFSKVNLMHRDRQYLVVRAQ